MKRKSIISIWGTEGLVVVSGPKRALMPGNDLGIVEEISHQNARRS